MSTNFIVVPLTLLLLELLGWETRTNHQKTITASGLIGIVSLVLLCASLLSPFVVNVDSSLGGLAGWTFVVCICVMICSFVTLCETKKFNEKFPPIDDKEFIRRCTPGVNVETALRVRRILSDSLGIDYERIYPEQSFVKDLDCG
jgi:hypothetical protein